MTTKTTRAARPRKETCSEVDLDALAAFNRRALENDRLSKAGAFPPSPKRTAHLLLAARERTKRVDAALEVLRDALAALTADELGAQLARIEITIDGIREKHDDSAHAVAPLAARARDVRRWARIAANKVQHGDERERVRASKTIARVASVVDVPPASVDVQIAVCRVIDFHASREATTAEALAAALASTLGISSVSPVTAEQILAAWRRGRGKRKDGAPTKHEALYTLLGPLGYAASSDAIEKSLKRHR